MQTETQKLQQYADQIYGQGFYKIEYQAFKGFFAVSQQENTPPHSQFLGPGANHAHSKLDELADLKGAVDTMTSPPSCVCDYPARNMMTMEQWKAIDEGHFNQADPPHDPLWFF